ncbi:MAG: 3,4-dihydroxy-2-butanone-4-phosphate synthase, partial [SAR116 cluster bacterium]|nr:3,4-dihydroxy-2-butanone-4-phosphate synthase [SAR116 cluster bacterium]
VRTVETVMNGRIGGEWRLMVFENTISGVEHVALIKGDISTPDPVLVRMHSLNMMTALLGEVSERRDGHELETAMQTISEQGRGVVVLLRESSKASLSATISAAVSGSSAPDTAQGLREYGVGAQILSELGVSRMVLLSDRPANVISLDGYDLEIVDWRRLNGESGNPAE